MKRAVIRVFGLFSPIRTIKKAFCGIFTIYGFLGDGRNFSEIKYNELYYYNYWPKKKLFFRVRIMSHKY